MSCEKLRAGIATGAVAGGVRAKAEFTRCLFLRGVSSSVSWCAARSRLPKGEFLRPDMVDDDGARVRAC